MELIDSVRRFIVVFALLIAIALSAVFLFDLFIATPINLPILLRQTIRIVMVVGFGAIILLFIRRSKPLLSNRVGVHATAVFQFFMGVIVVLVMFLAMLHIFGVPPETLLAGAGIASLTMGLIISTFVGDILAGTLVFITNPFRVGDSVLVNNVPGRIVDITALVTRIRTDVEGQIVIPNSAIASGAVVVTKIPRHESASHTRLPYSLGDRVYTTYMNEQGIVKELTSLHTKILLDSGKEITFLNSSVFIGSVAVAKITPKP